MNIVFFPLLVIFLTQQQSNAAVVRKPPAFSTPIYSNSYLPAAMQVIFHAVEQLKHLEAEEAALTTTIAVPTTSPHAPAYHQPSAEEQVSMQSSDMTAYEASTASIAYMAPIVAEVSTDSTVSEASTYSTTPDESTGSNASEALANSTVSEALQGSTASEALTGSTAFEGLPGSTASEALPGSTVSVESTASIAAINPTGSTPPFIPVVDDSQTPATVPVNTGENNEEKPEVVEEATVAITSEAETPEVNYATPEINHEVPEDAQEVTESNQEIPEKNEVNENSTISPSFSTSSEVEVPATTALSKSKKKKDSSDEHDCDKSSSEESKEESDEDKSKSSSETTSEEDQSSDEEDDEIRFTLIGEKVVQVPRPSLSSYLRKTAREPLRSSVQELATLYDALSKDARKQGLGKYSGYSDEVLQSLESSIEGGVGPQLRILLEKARDCNELTRDDAKSKLSVIVKKLADPASILSRDLRRLVPLRYIP